MHESYTLRWWKKQKQKRLSPSGNTEKWMWIRIWYPTQESENHACSLRIDTSHTTYCFCWLGLWWLRTSGGDGHRGRSSCDPAHWWLSWVHATLLSSLIIFLFLLLLLLIVIVLLRWRQPSLRLAAVNFPGKDRRGGGPDGVPPNSAVILLSHWCWQRAVKPASYLSNRQPWLVPVVIFIAGLLKCYLITVGIIVVELRNYLGTEATAMINWRQRTATHCAPAAYWMPGDQRRGTVGTGVDAVRTVCTVPSRIVRGRILVEHFSHADARQGGCWSTEPPAKRRGCRLAGVPDPRVPPTGRLWGLTPLTPNCIPAWWHGDPRVIRQGARVGVRWWAGSANMHTLSDHTVIPP